MLIEAARKDGDEKLSIPETIKKLNIIQQEMDKEKMAKKAKKAQELEAARAAETQRATAFLEEENLKNAQVTFFRLHLPSFLYRSYYNIIWIWILQ